MSKERLMDIGTQHPQILDEGELDALPDWSRIIDTIATGQSKVLTEWVKFPTGRWASDSGGGFSSGTVAVGQPILVDNLDASVERALRDKLAAKIEERMINVLDRSDKHYNAGLRDAARAVRGDR